MASFRSVLIANRGEIAIRIARSLSEAGIRSVGVYAPDDAQSLHVRRVDHAVALSGQGVAAYLDAEQLVKLARAEGCDAIHPGYGFLSENADFSRRCEEAGLVFIGPSADCLALLGDKARARDLAMECKVPLATGTNGEITLAEAADFLRTLKAEHGEAAGMMLKAVAGGGGRGMRPVFSADELEQAWQACQREASRAFGNDSLYAERLLVNARHIEVQVLGDEWGAVSHLWDRDCSLQRRRQKLVELAPAPHLSRDQREGMIDAALAMSKAAGLQGLATIEFLLDADTGDFVFMEANPRLQVEHTVTEAISGQDLVAVQLALAAGQSLRQLGLANTPADPGAASAVQVRINMESQGPEGQAMPAAGTLSIYEPPGGPGIRVDGAGYAGYQNTGGYDSLLAKLVVSGQGSLKELMRKTYRALCEFRVEGIDTNLEFLRNLARLPEVADWSVTTALVEQQLSQLADTSDDAHPRYFFDQQKGPQDAPVSRSIEPELPAGQAAVNTPVQGTVVRVAVSSGDSVVPGQVLAIVESMKMEFEVKASDTGQVAAVIAEEGATLKEGEAMFHLSTDGTVAEDVLTEESWDLELIRDDLAEVLERHDRLQDHRRPKAVAKRRKTGQRTARENILDLMDDGSFTEYGALALAARRRRVPMDELMESSPADGLIAGLGTVNRDRVGPDAARCMVMSYDYTVFAGTQGMMNHKKTDRMLQLADRWRLPLILFAEGGGGRPGDTDHMGVAGLDCHTFTAMASLSGKVPLIGIVSGRCFAGNAALLGCCDVIIATKDATLGMAGPAMIEGGGLGRFTPEEVGPVSVQGPNGVIDILVEDEAEAVSVARQYLSYLQGDANDWEATDQRLLRHLIPENRLRVYDIRRVIETLADDGSVTELRREFAPGLITALVRIEGRPFGLMANNPAVLGGALDAVSGDKAARFMQLCDIAGLPIVSLCDTPGFMVGPDAEQEATVRHVSRMFVTAAKLRVPFFTVVLRKGYGLGAQAMAAGSFHSPMFTIGWPSSEFGAMGLEGSVRLGYRKELEAIEDPDERQAAFEKMVAKAYEHGKGMNMASFLEIDAVIDPAETRRWVIRGLESSPAESRQGYDRSDRFIDAW
ncbi:biotin/lipoyl-binding protein [Marinobacter bryozoorum]|uniref:carboxyl transferase domain-containing protein n=1 Tax=Marinobacter bryozoorum TaxID=256324 RepID=UPI002006429F|nr:carboxyl transferase domain-containing protein [Marinobacter bryozoorum]MCK7543138.1 biotin/lipoyl-binding protein [Marinobacter bryozoorum]